MVDYIENRKKGKAWLWFQPKSGWQVTSFDPRLDSAIGFDRDVTPYICEDYVIRLEKALDCAKHSLEIILGKEVYSVDKEPWKYTADTALDQVEMLLNKP